MMRVTRDRHELKLERFLGKKTSIAILIILEDLLFFFLIHYLANLVFQVEKLLNDLDHPLRYVGLQNCLPDFRRIATYSDVFLFLYIVYFVFCLLVNIRQAYRIRASFSDKGFNLNQRGCARWTTEEEIKEQYVKIPDRDKSFPGYGGTIISRIGNSLYIDTDFVNNLIIGITRSGKGEMEVIPTIDVYSRAKKKTSMVVTDPKTELYKTSKKTLEKRGYLVYLLSLVDPEHSMGFNPLEQIVELYVQGDFSNAELLAQTFSYSIFNPDKPTNGDTFWQDTPTNLLTALILAHTDDCYRQDQIENERRREIWKKKRMFYEGLSAEQKQDEKDKFYQFREEHPEKDFVAADSLQALPESAGFESRKIHMKKVNMYSIINTFGELVIQRDPNNPDITALDMYFNKRPALDRAKMKYVGIEVAGDRTKGSIFASMFAKLTVFTYENIAKMTAESSFNLEEVGFGEKPIAVFLEIPDYDKSTHFLASVFIRQMYFVLAKKASRTKTGRCKNRVKVIADEFGNLPAIESMENIMTVCLGRNISFDLYIQAYAQLTKLYGENAKTITGNCGNTIYILSDDDETTERFSKNLGNETIIDLQRNGERLSRKKTLMETTLEKPLLNMNQLEELKEGECVIKRVMKRTDRKGKRITPHPIFNSEENGRRFLFRYEYLTDTFPNPGEIDLKDINTEDRSHINLKERVWDPRLSFKLLNPERSTDKKQKKEKNFLVCDLENRNTVIPAIEEAIGRKIPLDMEVALLESQLAKESLSYEQKQTFLNLLELGKRKTNTEGGA